MKERLAGKERIEAAGKNKSDAGADNCVSLAGMNPEVNPVDF
ncbi:MAG: hypothetical protein R3F50_01495 [Gammaproteobacteria bacterium]|jgi:hypothetical protein